MQLKWCLSFAVSAVAALSSVAQSRATFVDTFSHRDSSLTAGSLLLRLTNVDFLKNDEYFSDYIEGYTIIGYKLQPTLEYYVADNVSVEAGVQLLQYGGTDKFDRVCPVASARWYINDSFRLQMGVLDGHLQHDLPEQMWENERHLVDKPEMGLQAWFDGRRVESEVWLNWQQFIKQNDTIPEKFTFGARADFHLLSGQSGFYLDVPVRLAVSHVGGQISNYSGRMQSLSNGLMAVRVGYSSSTGYVRRIFASFECDFFHAMVDGGVRPFSDGSAFFPQLSLLAANLDATVGYWTARNYFSLYGNPTFMSLSNYRPEVYSKNRRLMVVEANFHHAVTKNVRFSLGGKGYYDADASQFDYSYHVHFVLSPSWRLKK